MKRTIIAISRQYGSGGRLVGKALADRLSIPFYDGSSLAPAAHGTEGVPNDEIVKLMERAPENYDASEKLLSYLEKSLMKISSSSCVIAGMAAGYLLRKDPDLITVFIHAPESARKDRAVNVYGADRKKIDKQLRRMDTSRASFFEYISDRKWGMARNYNISVDSSATGIEGAVDTIVSYLEKAGRL